MNNHDPLVILLIEDNPGDTRLVKEMLDEGATDAFELLHADQIGTAIPLLELESVDIILLDLGLPDGNGLDTLIKVHALAPEVPIVVLSQTEDESLAVKAVRIGAQDFLVKAHITSQQLTRSVRYAMERRQLQEHLHKLAHHDALTGLPNRKLFYDRLARAVSSARRHQRPLALMLLDMDDFKQVNDTHGHHVGDELLRQVADRLSACLRTTDCVARLGGDEFIIYVADLADVQDAARVAQKILDALSVPYSIEGHYFHSHSSLGIALHPEDGDDMEVLVRHADAAMYSAKQQGGNSSRFRFYSREIDKATEERNELHDALKLAFERNEFKVNYQPQVDLHSGRMIGVEALVRWQRSDGQIVMPAQFMPALEETGLIVQVGGWVMETACQQAKTWQTMAGGALKVGVNMSPRQFRDSQLVDRVTEALTNSGLPPHLLELELSEESLRDDEQLARDTLHRLNGLGIRLALDNYRGRTLSLRDLKRFPIHSVKLDKAIVRDMTENPEDAAIAQAVISVAHVFKMKGVAEGVETRGQADMLREQSCDDAQGYMFAKPLSADAFTQLLRGNDSSRYLQ
ncbi:MAG TPA: EAL domain-containing protein [Rhodocyclaceae bacterium]|jgi:diguanylate cyclase (GGDEF)-like protein